MPLIFHPSLATKNETDFFCATSPAEYRTRSRRYSPGARPAGSVIGLCSFRAAAVRLCERLSPAGFVRVTSISTSWFFVVS